MALGRQLRIEARAVAIDEAIKTLVRPQGDDFHRCVDARKRGRDPFGLVGVDLKQRECTPEICRLHATGLPLMREQHLKERAQCLVFALQLLEELRGHADADIAHELRCQLHGTGGVPDAFEGIALMAIQRPEQIQHTRFIRRQLACALQVRACGPRLAGLQRGPCCLAVGLETVGLGQGVQGRARQQAFKGNQCTQRVALRSLTGCISDGVAQGQRRRCCRAIAGVGTGVGGTDARDRQREHHGNTMTLQALHHVVLPWSER